MTDQEKRPSDTLKAPRRPLLIGGLVAAAVIAVSGAGVGAIAISQAAAPVSVAETVAPDPGPTEDPNLAPTPAITASVIDLTLTLDAAASTDLDGTIVEFLWDFGDGGSATDAATTHTYAVEGTYTVTLTVIDEDGASGIATYTAWASAPPPPPPAAPAPIRCPAGSAANSSDGYNDTSCFPNVCFTIALPDPAHPECDQAFKP